MFRLFISYSHRDADWCERLVKQLASPAGEVLKIWHDASLRPGGEWNPEIAKEMDRADIILLLVSANFIDSEFCGLEVERAMKLRQTRNCTVLPIMLRTCNIEGAPYEALEIIPEGPEKPIDSPKRRDKEQALTTVSKKVYAEVRELQNDPSRKLRLALSEDDLHGWKKLLHHFCDRGPQELTLALALGAGAAGSRRPFVLVVPGCRHDSLDWYASRLEHVLLRKYLGKAVGKIPLTWPELARGQRPLDAFRMNLRNEMSVPPFAALDELNNALNGMSPVTLVQTSLPAANFNKESEAVLDAYLEFWRTWPTLPAERMLIPLLLVEQPETLPSSHRLARYLKSLKAEFEAGLPGAVFPEMSEIQDHNFKDWLRMDKLRDRVAAPQQALDSFDRARLPFPVRMNRLADEHLPHFIHKL